MEPPVASKAIPGGTQHSEQHHVTVSMGVACNMHHISCTSVYEKMPCSQRCFSIGFVLLVQLQLVFGFKKYFWFSLVIVSQNFQLVIVSITKTLKPLIKGIQLQLSVKISCFLFQYSYGFFLYVLGHFSYSSQLRKRFQLVIVLVN